MIINGKLIEVAGKMRLLRGDDAFNPRNMDRSLDAMCLLGGKKRELCKKWTLSTFFA